MAMNIVNVLEDSSTGKLNQNQKGTGGAAHVRALSGTGEIATNKEINDLVSTTAQRVTWTAGQGITNVFVTVWPGVSTGSLIGDTVFICFNAPDDTVEATMLAEGSGLRYPVTVGTPRSFTIQSGTITKLSAARSADASIANFHLIAEAS